MKTEILIIPQGNTLSTEVSFLFFWPSPHYSPHIICEVRNDNYVDYVEAEAKGGSEEQDMTKGRRYRTPSHGVRMSQSQWRLCRKMYLAVICLLTAPHRIKNKLLLLFEMHIKIWIQVRCNICNMGRTQIEGVQELGAEENI
jgi:hypothetical protein